MVRDFAAAAGLEGEGEDDHGDWFYLRFAKPKTSHV